MGHRKLIWPVSSAREVLLACVLVTCVTALHDARSDSEENAQFLGVGAFYYVWYGTPEVDGAYMHWNHTVLPHWNAHVQAQHAGDTDFLAKTNTS
jgi:hypothetical protein